MQTKNLTNTNAFKFRQEKRVRNTMDYKKLVEQNEQLKDCLGKLQVGNYAFWNFYVSSYFLYTVHK